MILRPSPSKYTIRCPYCDRRISKTNATCPGCGRTVLDQEGEIEFLNLAMNFYNWNHDLGIASPRRRGLYRGGFGMGLVLTGGIILAVFKTITVGAIAVFLGFAEFPCALAEILLNQNWNDSPGIVRILLMLFTPVVFIFLIIFILSSLPI